MSEKNGRKPYHEIALTVIALMAVQAQGGGLEKISRERLLGRVEALVDFLTSAALPGEPARQREIAQDLINGINVLVEGLHPAHEDVVSVLTSAARRLARDYVPPMEADTVDFPPVEDEDELERARRLV